MRVPNRKSEPDESTEKQERATEPTFAIGGMKEVEPSKESVTVDRERVGIIESTASPERAVDPESTVARERTTTMRAE
jgi:hypothetical protein